MNIYIKNLSYPYEKKGTIRLDRILEYVNHKIYLHILEKKYNFSNSLVKNRTNIKEITAEYLICSLHMNHNTSLLPKIRNRDDY